VFEYQEDGENMGLMVMVPRLKKFIDEDLTIHRAYMMNQDKKLDSIRQEVIQLENDGVFSRRLSHTTRDRIEIIDDVEPHYYDSEDSGGTEGGGGDYGEDDDYHDYHDARSHKKKSGRGGKSSK